MVGAHHGDAERLVAGEYLRGRVAVAAAVADLDDRSPRPHGGEEGGGRGRPTAVMRHDQHVAAQRRRRAREERVLLRRLDVAGQQRAAAGDVGDAQDAADGVGLDARPIVAGRRVQHLEADVVPAPRLAGLAANVRHRAPRAGPQGMAGLEGAAQHGHRQAVEDGPGATDMVGVRMAQHERVDVRLAARMQQGQQHPPTGVVVRPEARAGVEQQQVPAGADQHRAALPDIDGDELEAPGRRPRHARREQWQQQRQAQRAHAPRHRKHQQGAPGEAGDEAPGWRGRDVHAGPGPGAEDLQPGQQGAHGQRRQLPERRQHATRERERRHDQRDPRLGHEVRSQADERDLLEGDQRQRRQPEARDDLGTGARAQRAAQGVQGARGGAPSGRRRLRRRRGARRLGGHQQADGRERQPEAGLQQRPRVERRHRHHRGKRHQQRGPVQAEAAQERRRREHQHGAARRHAPARKQRVAPGDGDPAPARRQRRGQDERRVPGPPPEAPDGAAAQPREHRDVQARDADQVRHAGVAEQLPAGATDRGLVADGQRREDARSPRLGDGEEEAVAHGLARAFDRREALVQQLARAAHAARRAQALLEEPQLGVEAVGIERAVRQLQAHGQAPALARADGRRHLGPGRIVTRRAAPGQPDARRDAGRGCACIGAAIAPGARQRARRLDGEREALAFVNELRHLVDDADELDVAPFPLGGERVREARVGMPARRGKGQPGHGGQRDEPRGDARDAEPRRGSRRRGRGGRRGRRGRRHAAPCVAPSQRAAPHAPGHPGERERARREQPIRVTRPERRLLQLQRRARYPGQHERRAPGRAQRIRARRCRAAIACLRAVPGAGRPFPAHAPSLRSARRPAPRRSPGFPDEATRRAEPGGIRPAGALAGNERRLAGAERRRYAGWGQVFRPDPAFQHGTGQHATGRMRGQV
jgi:hypothetical protein